MSDVGLPPGMMVWLGSLAWCFVCALALVVCLLIAWMRTRDDSKLLVRDPFAAYAMGAWVSGMAAGLSIYLLNWSGSLGTFSHWVDRPLWGALWLGMLVLIWPVVAVLRNRACLTGE